MLGAFIRKHFDAGEIKTSSGRALVEERYSALRRQIPIIYVIAVVNLCGLQLATAGRLVFGANVPTVLLICSLVRIAQWLRSRKTTDHGLMLRRMRQTCLLAAAICLVVMIWCMNLQQTDDRAAALAVILFGGMTAIGVSYGLSALPSAARLPLLVLALPLAGVAFLSNDPRLVGAALSLAIVSLLMLRLLDVNNAHFRAVVESRSIIARQQELTETARQEAIVAATTDFLTGLPNRRAFVAALEAEIEKTGKGGSFAVGIVDLDRFKVINDTFGHATGDELLETVARRLLDAAGRAALVARLGGDEFGLLFPGIKRSSDAKTTAERVLAHVNRPATVDGRQFAISVCCGFAVAREAKGRSPSRVLVDADLALYEAKDHSAGGVAVFEAWMEAPRRRRAQIERALRLPHVHERIDLVFQPIIELRTGRLIANEALARWDDDELGQVSPAEFIPLAEQLNVIGSISDYLMIKAFTEAAHWPSPIRLSFNLSAVHLCAAGSAEAILDALRKTHLPVDRLQVEVTETALLRDLAQAKENLARLRTAGVTIVLDDFGAGYASIGYLKELQFDQIKLDGGLLMAAEESADGERLLRAVIDLCHALGVSTVAEHVESERQLKLLLTLGCASGQGYWLQPPLSAEACRDYSRATALVSTLGAPAKKSSAA